MSVDSSGDCVQLGFAVPLEGNNVSHESPNWMDWDGGHIGGHPSWLQPRDIPKKTWTCPTCNEPLKFLCQVYAPPASLQDHAFHRTIYVFGCHSTIRVLRTQLPQENEFYPTSCDDTKALSCWKKHKSSFWNLQLCKVCGQHGKGKCPIQGVYFCGRQHQKEHKKGVFDKQKKVQQHNGEEEILLPSVYAKHELVVEQEPSPNNDTNKDNKNWKAIFESDEKDDLDENLRQEDLNQMTGATASTKDPVTLEFYARIARPNNAQEQCLRYCQWPNDTDEENEDEQRGPLWISSNNQPTTIPPCPYCGSCRKFEFQLQPQMLYHLLKNHKRDKQLNDTQQQERKQALMAASKILDESNDGESDAKEAHNQAVARVQEELFEKVQGEMDWGVVAVYTCTASCSDNTDNDELGAYREEYAWRQPPLEEL